MLTKCSSELGANSNTFRSNFQRYASKLHTGLRTWSWLCRQCCRSLLEKQVCSWGKDSEYISVHTLHSPICRRSCWCARNPTPTVCSATVLPMRCVVLLLQCPWMQFARGWLKALHRNTQSLQHLQAGAAAVPGELGNKSCVHLRIWVWIASRASLTLHAGIVDCRHSREPKPYWKPGGLHC